LKKVILIVLNNFKNDSRVLKEAISLQNGNFNVRVVALYEEGVKEYEEIEGIKVHRIRLKSREWIKVRMVQVFKYFELIYRLFKGYRDIDIIHCNDLETLPLGVILKKFNRKIKIVYDAHEYETETYYSKGIRKKIAQKLELWLIKYADEVITVSGMIADEYVKLYSIKRPTLVLNTPILQNIKRENLFRERFDISENSRIFLYQGALNRGRGIEMILETFRLLDRKSVIIFMGYGVLENHIKKYTQEYDNIYLHEAVSPSRLLPYTSSADFGISLIEDSCLSYRYCLPNKMFEYIMVGLPVIVSNLPEMAKVVKEYNIGVVAKEHSIDGLKEAIVEATNLNRDSISQNIKKVKEIYNWEKQEERLLGVYNGL